MFQRTGRRIILLAFITFGSRIASVKNNIGFAVVYVFSPDSCSSLADRVHP